MNRNDVRDLAERVIRPVFDDRDIEDILVREDDDWSGAPSLYIDVYVGSNVRRPNADTWNGVVRSMSEALLAASEQRFPYIQMRDRISERENPPGEAA